MDAPQHGTDDTGATGGTDATNAGAGLPWTETLPLTTVETFVAAMIEAGPEVAEHMVRAANELLLAAQALMGAAERRLAEQRRIRDAEAADAADAAAPTGPAGPTEPAADVAVDADAPVGGHLRSVDEVA